ncbi:uncharacterized protein ACA1_338910 [Acanthamoeba castellanii str. Neff]|uniref:Uncharacterized protein n=1 Tax=Acanthamoeba castellanii (strain ATCC 30010 / Neff) TaxID=1257118 RepID=L8H7C6_ACACF|nr:uncharacterized protein ACA1_338910 [Acanthamoeba castellanii str. Neff]ELR20391.1 hypothetical protein ACA1_338910 [Acanthamoeba castellanii str. Neff]
MEWSKMDIRELLGDLEDEEDHTDQHWKRSANDQPTTSSASHQDTHNKQHQATEPRRPGTTLSSRLGEEIQSGEEFHPDLPSYEPPQPERQSFTFGPQQPSYQRGGPPGQPAIPASHAQEDRPTKRQSWARGPENQRNDVRQGWGRSSDKRSHNNRPYRPRDTHCRAEAKRHHSHQHTHQHTHYKPWRNWHQSRSSLTRDYSQEHKHNKHMGTTSDAARGRKRSRERTDHFTHSSHARPAHHHHQGSSRDKRRRREDEGHQHELRANPTVTPGEPCDVPEAGHLQDEEKRRAEDDDRTRLDQEQQEWARIRAMTDKHLSNGEQPSPASNMEKRTTDERLNLAWHRLPTPFVFELAEVPYTVLASASGAEMSTLVEKNLKRKRVHLQRAIERQGNDGSSTAVESSCGSQVINALLDWCRAELFPFLAEVDLMAHAADAMGRASSQVAIRKSQFATDRNSQVAIRRSLCARRKSCRVCVG